MSIKIKPQRIDANNSPQAGYVPKYVDEQTFEWGAGSGATDIGNNYLILTGTMAGTPPEVDITDTRITDTTPYLVFYETEPVGNITRTLTNGNLNIVSDDNADTLDVKVLFWNIGPARNYMKGNTTLTGAGPWVITDPRITAITPAMLMPRTAPVGYLTAVTGAGTLTISSTGTETGVIVDYIITLDTTNYSDGMPYNATLDDDDMFFRKGAVIGDDEAVKWGDMKGDVTSSLPSVLNLGFCSRVVCQLTLSGYSNYVFGKFGVTDDINTIPTYLNSPGGVSSNTMLYGATGFLGDMYNGWYELLDSTGTQCNGICIANGYLYVYGQKSSVKTIYRNPKDGTSTQVAMTISGYSLDNDDFLMGHDGTYLYIGRASGTTDIRRFTISGLTLTYVDTVTSPFTLLSAADVACTHYFVSALGYFNTNADRTYYYDLGGTLISDFVGYAQIITPLEVYCVMGGASEAATDVYPYMLYKAI